MWDFRRYRKPVIWTKTAEGSTKTVDYLRMAQELTAIGWDIAWDFGDELLLKRQKLVTEFPDM